MAEVEVYMASAVKGKRGEWLAWVTVGVTQSELYLWNANSASADCKEYVYSLSNISPGT